MEDNNDQSVMIGMDDLEARVLAEEFDEAARRGFVPKYKSTDPQLVLKADNSGDQPPIDR